MRAVKLVAFCAPPSLLPRLRARARPVRRARARPKHEPPPPPRARHDARGPSALPRGVENALLINAVPLLWASYGPAIKLLAQHVPDVPVLLLNLLCFVPAQLSISAARALARDRRAAPLRAGLELGAYLFAGSLLNLAALSLTSAPRAAFLVQLTTVFVPLLSFARGARVEARVWPSAALALAGAVVLGEQRLSLALNGGDALALLAALCYSAHVIRLDEVARHAHTLPLVDAKTRTQLVLAALSVLLFAPQSAHYVRTLSTADAGALAAGALWVGAATTSAATCLQVAGQRRVGATRAAVFYASQPVWAALLALALRLDTLSAHELVGGALIVAAGVLLAVSARGSPSEEAR